jgi:hypothetical protein|nr:MAG TPA: hypothetical protein [Caudoviricetes sp.]DAO69582.1 MAG TPA: hypothetical protein [Bacteriophage sp.]DAV77914.1 MAG TPA: hypothetical protein [Bacteriophage sp.]DAW06771.1 MAG TPA: hypothetical protein [Bacteriophage sp.]
MENEEYRQKIIEEIKEINSVEVLKYIYKIMMDVIKKPV